MVFINIHSLYQCNKSIPFSNMDGGVENGDVSGGHFFMNSHTIYEANNPRSIYSTNKRDGKFPSILFVESMELRLFASDRV